MGLVRYRGAIYPGKHRACWTPETWQQVQDLLTAKYLVGEKQREHPHYLKGSIYCGTVRRSPDRQPRQRPKGRHLSVLHLHRPPAGQAQLQQRAIRIELVEEAVAAHYATVQLPDDELASATGLPGRRTNEASPRC